MRDKTPIRRIPRTLPPPYTATGTQAGQLRCNLQNYTSTTTLLIGDYPNPHAFTIHTTLLIRESPYFRAALTGPFVESSTQQIHLPDLCPNNFHLAVTWLYTSAIRPIPFKDGKPAYYTLLHLWILADRLAFEGLRNCVVDAIAELADKTNSVLTPSDTRLLYSAAVPPGSLLTKLVLDLFAFKKTDRLLEGHEDLWHAGFLRDLLVRCKRPCEQALLRHYFCLWFPSSSSSSSDEGDDGVGKNWWQVAVRACDNCRMVLPPKRAAFWCETCCVAWCVGCVRGGVGMASWEDERRDHWGDMGVCDGIGGGTGGIGGFSSLGSYWKGGRESGGSGSAGSDSGVSVGSGAGGAGEGSRTVDLEPEGVASRRGEENGYVMETWESCKPWRGARCLLYHEHRETERCADIFMGR